MIDAVLSYHANPETCGVTKFNMQLAEKLGVPHYALALRGPELASVRHPLLSLKASEMDESLNMRCSYDLLWHDEGIPSLSSGAARVQFAKDTGCPATIRGNASRKGIALLSFGMAHKFNLPHFEKLKALLDTTPNYTVSVSSAIHEGSPWDQTTATHTAMLRELFGDHLRWLGFLADDALAREIREAHTIALFYQPAARANNTTLWAAMEAGTPVITNLDEHSPKELQHHVSVFDIAQMTEWPEYDGMRQDIRAGARKAVDAYSWDKLLEKLTAVHA